ncbi:superinfection immunity protein [Streptomyces sp. NBC_01005]|uniref:superinfection immunity protein n=1 Tax=unclassified Streptomyces TaxID=2593676 RepID=UPI002E315A43|nr:superinfection immunity protein [Streptomyces sp. NBC_01362]WSW10241.1 superinfection immunity protein [Streptomyces sp. NBC_01005]WTC99750.1 superinfection immunity protein [Streptomyces sp. NBC_01650]
MFSDIGPVELFAAIPVALLVLSVPSIVAYRRKVQRLRPVIAVNAIGAFTGLFWFVALFMAVSMRTRDPDPTLPADGHLAP